MKKFLLLGCCYLASVILASCTPNPAYSNLTPETSTPIPSPTPIPENFSDFSLHVYNTFISAVQTDGAEYRVYTNKGMDRSENDGDPSYTFSINIGSLSSCSVDIYENSRSLKISFSGNYFDNKAPDPKMIKSTIRSTIKCIDPEASKDKIEALMDVLVSSYDGSSYSKIVDYRGYSLFLEPDPFFKGIAFYALYRDYYLSKAIDIAEYKQGSKAAITAPLNAGELYFAIGTVMENDYSYASISPARKLTVKTESDEYIPMSYNYVTIPIELSIGKKFVFYGKVSGGSPTILLINHVSFIK